MIQEGWGYTKQEVYVNTIDQTRLVDGGTVVTAAVNNGMFVADWAKKWKEWTDFSSSEEIIALSLKATETLRRAGSAAKGNWKGKKGPRAE